MAEYIERDAALRDWPLCDEPADAYQYIRSYPAADVRHVVVCANCEHNNHCLTQEFVDDCSKIPLDRNTFFCADGERRSNA